MQHRFSKRYQIVSFRQCDLLVAFSSHSGGGHLLKIFQAESVDISGCSILMAPMPGLILEKYLGD
ncbi:hypothetical protein AU191_20325 [Mycolicibacterium acapulense]|nr:hypothetical protein AU191_20325 [Mycolicibacterium acapulense]